MQPGYRSSRAVGLCLVPVGGGEEDAHEDVCVFQDMLCVCVCVCVCLCVLHKNQEGYTQSGVKP